MVDATVRDHERRWRETGAPDDEVRWLVARARAGELTAERLELAARLGSRAARAALDGRVREWDPPKDDPRAWLMALVAWGDEVLVRALAFAIWALTDPLDACPACSVVVAPCWTACSTCGAPHPAPDPSGLGQALAAVVSWCDEPGEARARRARALGEALQPLGWPQRWAQQLTVALDGPPSPRQLLLSALLAAEDLDVDPAWLACEGGRLLRDWALDLPLELRARPPSAAMVSRPDELAARLRARFGRGEETDEWMYGSAHFVPTRCTPLRAAAWLRRQRVLEVTMPGDLLQHAVLPSGGSHGLVLVDRQDAWFLDRRHPERFTRMLQNEGGLASDVEPADLATVASAALLAERNHDVRVLSSLDGIRDRAGYTLDETAATTYAISPPTLERDQGGWTLTFCALSGWMHETQRLTRVTLRADAHQRVSVADQVLCERVYSHVPPLMY